MLDTYIVEESPGGIRLTDQHALHECILYGRLRRQLESGPPASQRLLVPELVELPKAEFLAVMELAEDLKRFGMDVEAFGESTVIVRSYPQMLGRFDARAFLQDVLDELEGPEGTRRVDGRLEKLLKVMACRGAVKAGQRADILLEYDEKQSFRGQVLRLGEVFGSRKLANDDPNERQDTRVVEMVVAVEGEQPLRIGQRVLVRVMP